MAYKIYPSAIYIPPKAVQLYKPQNKLQNLMGKVSK